MLYAVGESAPLGGRLRELAKIMGRHPGNLVRKAHSLGLAVNRRRPKRSEPRPKRKTKDDAELRALTSLQMKECWRRRGHPRGALGMRHTEEVKQRIARQSRERWQAMTEDQIAERQMKISRTRAANGKPNERHGVRWKGGWREIGGIRKYYRSRWEANYARYLEWLRGMGKVAAWAHEPETFWFDGIRRGCVSYLPDFKVTHADGRVEYHEVKGWMDAASATKIKRMAKYHPQVTLIVVDGKAYTQLARSVGALIAGWE